MSTPNSRSAPTAPLPPGRVDERVELAGIPLRNPVLTASGTFGYGTELAPFLDLERIGGFVAKSLTLEPRSTEPGGYAELAARVAEHPRVSGLEINASCPHVKSGGIEFGQDPALLGELVRTVRRAIRLPLLVKLSPNVTRIADMARVCEAEGADGVSLINAIQAMEVDVGSRRPVLSNVLGGLSGPAIRPIALRMVWQVARAVKIPICGVGGISDAADAVKFLLCGARAVQVGTQNYLDPSAAGRIAQGIAEYAARHGFARVADLTGALEAPRD